MVLRELIAVPQIETVVRLMSVESDRAGQGASVLRSFVLTEEVERGLKLIFSRLRESSGCGIFLKGNYGSGKSHFLAFLSLILEGEGTLTDLSSPLISDYFRQRRAPCLVVRVALHQFPASRSLEDILWEAIEHRTGQMGGEPLLLRSASRLIEQFSRYVLPEHPEFLYRMEMEQKQWEEVCGEDPEHAARRIWSFLETLEESPLKAVYDRETALQRVMKYVADRGLEGLFLFVDELSEFLKSKPTRAGFNEDIRFLQFLAEGFRDRPSWIIAALQENIETTGYIEEDLVLKVKDRFPARINLTAHHVGELIGSRLVEKREGAEPIIREVYHRFLKAYPRSDLTWETLWDLYPVHPSTVSFLEGLTALFSQHRGVIDFIYHQLTGDPNRGWPGMMDLEETALLAPDAIFDHFRERMRDNPDLVAYVDVIYEGLSRAINRIFADEQERRLAHRAVKVLILVEVSPLERRLTAEELAPMLNEPVSELDERMNVRFLEDVILETLVREADFLHKETNSAGQTVFYVSHETSPHQQLRYRVKALMLERPLGADDLAQMARYLTRAILPLGNIAGARRRTYRIEWQGTTRQGYVSFHRGLPGFQTLMSVEQELQTTEADFFLLVLGADPEGQLTDSSSSLRQLSGRMSRAIVLWKPRPFDDEERTFLHTFWSYHLTREALRREATQEAKAVLPLVDEWIENHQTKLEDLLLDAYLRGEIWGREDKKALSVVDHYPRFGDLLKHIFSDVLESLFPDHARVMPLNPISTYAKDRLFEALIRPGSLSIEEARAQRLVSDLEAYLSPLGLVRRTEAAFVLEVDPENTPLMREILDTTHGESPRSLFSLYWSFRKGTWGLTRPFFELLLSALLVTGRLSAFRSSLPVRFRSLQQLSDDSIDGVGRGALLDEPAQAAFVDFFSEHEPELFQGPFSLSVQEGMWKSLKDLREETEEALGDAESLAARYATYPAFRALEDGLSPDGELLRGFVVSVRVSYPAIKGLEKVFEPLGGHGLKRLAKEIKRLRAWREFLRTRFPEFNTFHMYLSDPNLGRMASVEGFPLRGDYWNLTHRIGEPEALYGQEPFQEIVRDFQTFKEAYTQFYVEEHRRFYAGEVFQERDRLEKSPQVQVLKKLYQVEALRGGKDWIDFQHHLSQLPSPCRRQLETALVSAPLCGCGFVPSQPHPASSFHDLQALALQGIRETLTQLTTDFRWIVESYIRGLQEAGDRPAATALQRILAIHPDDLQGEIEPLNRLLTPEVLDHIRKALAGKVMVVTRSVDALIRELTQRRMKVGELRGIFERWLSGEESPEDEVLVRLERELALPFDKARYRALEAVIHEDGGRFFEAFWLAAWAMQYSNIGFVPWVEERYRFRTHYSEAIQETLRAPEIGDETRRAEIFLRERDLLDAIIWECCRPKERSTEELAHLIMKERLLEAVSMELSREFAKRLSANDPYPDFLTPLAEWLEEHAPPWPHLRTLSLGIELLNLADLAERKRKRAQVKFYLQQGWQMDAKLEHLLDDASGIGLFSPPFGQKLGQRIDKLSEEMIWDRQDLVSEGPKGVIPMEAIEEDILRDIPAHLQVRMVVLVIDAMRWDVWEFLKETFAESLPQHQLVKEGALLAATPSTTEINRPLILRAFSGKTEPSFFPSVESLDARERILLALEDPGRPVILNTTIIDGLLHTLTDPVTTLIRMVASRLEAQVLPILAKLPPERPLVILADHGFVRTRSGDYIHGGNSLQELLVPYSLWLPKSESAE